MSEDEATALLLSNLDGAPLAEPRTVTFAAGKRKKAWNKNCISIGLSSGFLEPLESTSIHLIQMGIAHLLTYFPAPGFEPEETDAYNRVMNQEYDWVRDFIILHYKATERNDSPFWNYCRQMEVPESLTERMNLFRSHGRVHREGNELFTKVSWLQVMHGQRIHPKAYHPLTDLLSEEEIQNYLEEVEGVIKACVNVMPTHADFIAKNCAASASH